MNQPLDPAALLRAGQKLGQPLPDALGVGKSVTSPQYGTGKVTGWLGNRLIVKFPGYSVPLQFPNWQESIASGELVLAEITPSESSPSTPAILAAIQRLKKPEFRAIATELAERLTYITVIPPIKGRLHPIPADVPPVLTTALAKIGIDSLYEHQLEALTLLRQGKDIVIATPTASGKTLCYNLPILESCLRSPEPTALYLFPLKALAFDQTRKLQTLNEVLPPNASLKIGQMTGDTSQSERWKLFYPDIPRILAVSPDLLHYQLEKIRGGSQGQGWRDFLRSLRWVVIDEAHTYTGAFGAHFANLTRRLRRAVDSVGGNSDRLQFICTSATLGNPVELLERFGGRADEPKRLKAMDTGQGTAASKTFLSLAPTTSPNPDTVRIVLSLLQQELSGIVFCYSRTTVKNLLKLLAKEAENWGNAGLARRVAPFYGSMQSEQRRRLIQQLETGEIRVLLSTSALEAGIDLPELDCCIIRGYPGSIMSFRQRIGRVGRRRSGLVIFLPIADDPLDHYYGTYPERLLSDGVENVAFNPDYPTLLAKHLLCCCAESGLGVSEVLPRFGEVGGRLADELLRQNKLFLKANGFLHAVGMPHHSVNLRGNPQQAVKLIDLTTKETIEEMGLELAHREVFPDALYTAIDGDGRRVVYRCRELNEQNRTASLEPLGCDSDLSTQPETDLTVAVRTLLAEPKILSTPFPDARLRIRLHWGEITSSVTGYQRLKRQYRLTCTNPHCSGYHLPLKGKSCPQCHRSLRTAEITDVEQKITFPTPYRTGYEAPVLKIELNPGVTTVIREEVARLRKNLTDRYGDNIPDTLKHLWTSAPDWLALHSMGHQLIFAVPLLVLSSRSDVNFVVEREDKRSVGYFFDTCDGGNGATEAIFQNLPRLADKARVLVEACDCEYGCPRCLTQHGCPQRNEGLNRDLGLFLLKAIGESASSIE